PVQAGDERHQREQQRGDVEPAARRGARLARVQPEQRGEDQEPGREQDQRQHRQAGDVVHGLPSAPSSCAATKAASAALTSSSVTPSPSAKSLAPSPISPCLIAAMRCPASRGESKPTLCSSTRSPCTSLK